MTTNTIKRSKQGTVVVDDIIPSFSWSEDHTSHYLLVDLPGFKREEVKLQIDNAGMILASGERKANNDNKIIRFKQTFMAPDNSEKDKTTGKFEAEILHVIVPKKIIEKNHEQKELDNLKKIIERNHEQRESGNLKKIIEKDKEQREPNNLRCDEGMSLTTVKKKAETMMEMVKKNKGIIITAVLAFSLGVFVSKNLFIEDNQSSNES